MSRCHDIRPYLEAFVDDELSPERYLDVERHLGDCAQCAERAHLSRCLKRTTRDVVLAEATPSCSFRDRLNAALEEECRRQQPHHRHRPLPWRYIAPLAAAAVAVLAIGVSQQRLPLPEGDGARATQATVAPNPEHLIDELVQYHASQLAPEVTDHAQVNRLEPSLGVPVRAPELRSFGAQFVGASVIPVESHRAASLQYQLGKHRVTVYVFNADQVPLRALRALEPRVVRDRAVFVGHRGGYSIAAVERQGVGYAVATDLDDRESAELVASIR